MSVIWEFGWLFTWSPRLEIASSDQVIDQLFLNWCQAAKVAQMIRWSTLFELVPRSLPAPHLVSPEISLFFPNHNRNRAENGVTWFLLFQHCSLLAKWCWPMVNTADSNCGSSQLWSSCTGARLELPRPRNTQDTSYNTRNTGHCISNTEHGTLHITHMALHSEVHIVHETQGKLEKTRDPPHNTRNTQDNRFNTYNT